MHYLCLAWLVNGYWLTILVFILLTDWCLACNLSDMDEGNSVTKWTNLFITRTMLSQHGTSCHLVFIRLSVIRRYCTRMAERTITETAPRDSPVTVVFWRRQLLLGDAPFPLKFVLKVTHPPFEHNNFDHYLLIVPQSWELAKNVLLALIGGRPRAFHRAIDEPCALSLSPPNGGSRREFLHLALPFISSLQVIVETSDLVYTLNIASPSSLQMTNRPWNGRTHCHVTSNFWKISDII